MATKKDWQNNIPVTKGGLFEKYEGNTPLSVISEKYPEIDLSWLETIKKKKTIVSGSEISP